MEEQEDGVISADQMFVNKKNVQPPSREALLQMLGETVKVIYKDEASGLACGVVAWLFRIYTEEIRFKITSTRGESYQAESVQINDLISVTPCDFD